MNKTTCEREICRHLLCNFNEQPQKISGKVGESSTRKTGYYGYLRFIELKIGVKNYDMKPDQSV